MSFFDFVASVLDGVLGNGANRTTRLWTNDDVSPEAFADLSAGDTQQAAGPPPKPMYEQEKDQVVALQKIDPDFSDVTVLQQAAKTYQAALAAEGGMNAAALGSAATQAFADQLAQRVSQWQSAGLVHTVSGATVHPPMLFKVSVDG